MEGAALIGTVGAALIRVGAAQLREKAALIGGAALVGAALIELAALIRGYPWLLGGTIDT